MFRFLVDKMLQFVDVKIIQFQFALEATRLGWETPRYQRLPPPYSTVQYSTVQYSTVQYSTVSKVTTTTSQSYEHTGIRLSVCTVLTGQR